MTVADSRFFVLLVIVMVTMITAAPTLSSDVLPKVHKNIEWSLWKAENGKIYKHLGEEMERYAIWLSNKKYIEQHNSFADNFGFSLAMNEFGDMTDMEWFTQYSNDYVRGNYTKEESNWKRGLPTNGSNNYPDSLDWRSKNAVTPVKNQGACGASYAFSAIGALEGATALAHDKLVTLSEQNIVDCSIPYGNHGCNGGNVREAYQYIISMGGVDTSESYPYKSKQNQCRYNKHNSGASMSGVVRVPSGSEKELLVAVATVGPLSVSVDASSNAFRFYSDGVFNSLHCSNTKLTHSMLLTGYGTYEGKQYWLVKNSWGTSWGQGGYIMMSKDHYNQCGIATDGSYPTL